MKRLEPTLSGGTGTYASRMNSIEQQLDSIDEQHCTSSGDVAVASSGAASAEYVDEEFSNKPSSFFAFGNKGSSDQHQSSGQHQSVSERRRQCAVRHSDRGLQHQWHVQLSARLQPRTPASLLTEQHQCYQQQASQHKQQYQHWHHQGSQLPQLPRSRTRTKTSVFHSKAAVPAVARRTTHCLKKKE